MPLLWDSAVDFLLVTWGTASVMLLSQFGRYALRIWRTTTFREVQLRISFFNGLIIHHIGNLTLLLWFWTKLHHGDIYISSNAADAMLIVAGMVIAIAGVFYKIKVFSYSGWETLATVLAAMTLSAVSVLALHKHWL